MSPNQAIAELLRLLDAGRLPQARELVERMRREGTGASQLAAEVLHEVRQPLLGIKAYAQLLRDGGDPAQAATQLIAQTERIEAIIADFTRLASDRPAPREALLLDEPVRRAVEFFTRQPDQRRLEVELALATDVQVHANARLIEQLVLNLLANAREALGGEGRIRVTVRHDGGAPVLEVADWGPGISPENAERIFEPYVTGHSRGTGLGLAVCRRIAREHGAQLTVSAPGSGPGAPSTTFRLCFDPEVGASVTKRLLVVDDESILRQVFVDLMGRECELVTAESAEEALVHLGRGHFDLIVTDKNLPGMSGLDLAREARERDPHSRVIVMTGYPSLVTAQEALELGVLDYLLKPFDDIREVRELLRTALAAPRPPPVSSRAAKRVDVLDSDPVSAALLKEALDLIGMEARLVAEPEPLFEPAPAAVIVSWDFAPASGSDAVNLARETARGAPFVVLAEHLSLDCTLESLRGGATACLPKLTRDARVLSRELARALGRRRG